MSLLKQLAHRYSLRSVRHFRLTQYIYNLAHYRNLSYLKPLYKQYGLKRSFLKTLQFDDLIKLNPERASTSSVVHLPNENDPKFLALPKEFQEEIKLWPTRGYLHLRNFFSEEIMNSMGRLTEGLWDSSKGKWRFGDRRVLSAFENDEMWNFYHQQQFVDVVTLLLGKEVVLLNNINFLRGDDQPMHSDSFYMTTYPMGNLIGSWIALEDIDDQAGPLRYIPGSHRLPYVTNHAVDNLGSYWKTGKDGDDNYIEKVKEIIAENGLSPEFHFPKKGDLFLWHANLLHGGSTVKDRTKTRKSMVGHFVAKNSICYHENSQRPAMRFSKK